MEDRGSPPFMGKELEERPMQVWLEEVQKVYRNRSKSHITAAGQKTLLQMCVDRGAPQGEIKHMLND